MNWFRKSNVTNQSLPDVTDSILYDDGPFTTGSPKIYWRLKKQLFLESFDKSI